MCQFHVDQSPSQTFGDIIPITNVHAVPAAAVAAVTSETNAAPSATDHLHGQTDGRTRNDTPPGTPRYPRSGDVERQENCLDSTPDDRHRCSVN